MDTYYVEDIKIMPEYFDRYIKKVGEISVLDALSITGAEYLVRELENFQKLGDRVYAEGKWTIRQIIQHIIDTERIFSYRALRFARNDQTILPGFEENGFVLESNANERSLESLIYEYDMVRKSTIELYKSFTNEMMMREGRCFNKMISVIAIAFTMAGHTIHHVDVIKERYYSML